MARHHLVFKTFPEVLKAIFNRLTLKVEYVFDLTVIVGGCLDLKSRHSIKHSLAILNLV